MTPEIEKINTRRATVEKLENELQQARNLANETRQELAEPVSFAAMGTDGVKTRVGGRRAMAEILAWCEGYAATLAPKLQQARRELEIEISAWHAKSHRFHETAKTYHEQIIHLREQLETNPQARQTLEGQIAEMEKKYHATERQAQEFLKGGTPDSYSTV